MTSVSQNPQNARFGFVSIIQVPELGYCGGLLILNSLGRPTEFHCTAPVPENRAQRILYGQTYESFLYCDQIGLALVGKTKQRPELLITNDLKILPLNELVESPVLLVTPQDEQTRLDLQSKSQQLDYFDIHEQRIWTESQTNSVLDQIRQLCFEFTESIPIDEPFERIAQAIEEAQAVVR